MKPFTGEVVKVCSGPQTEHDLAIGEILDKASDLHKSVIGACRCEAGHESNVATLSSSKFNATTLSSCAVYLGIKGVDHSDFCRL